MCKIFDCFEIFDSQRVLLSVSFMMSIVYVQKMSL